MTDLVERLRDLHRQATSHYYVGKCTQEAADRIEALEAALRGLIEAVRIDSDDGGKGISGNTSARLYDARAALAPEPDKP